jgi:hypothetical protein
MSKFSVKDVEVGQMDSTGSEILTVYGKIGGKSGGKEGGRYAVYRNSRQVMIQFADDDDLGVNQRAALSPIVPLRSQITTMISKLLGDPAAYQQEKALEYANRLGISLLIALQGNLPLAETVMITIRDDMVEDKASDTRTWHILWATLATLGTVAIATILASSWFVKLFTGLGLDKQAWPNCWHAVAGGAMGALFSIALQIRARQVRIDSREWDNISDAVLRILVGATSGALLSALFLGKFIDIKIGETSIADSSGYGTLIIAFAGGFTERLVAEFLSKMGLTGNVVVAPPQTAAPAAGTNERTVTGSQRGSGASGATEQPLTPVVTPASAKVASEHAIEPDEDQDEADPDEAPEKSDDDAETPPVG